MHGYEIRKAPARRARPLRQRVVRVAVPGAVPPGAAGRGAGDRGPGRTVPTPLPMTGSLSGERAALRARRAGSPRGTKRCRKVYRITDEGREQFASSSTREPAGADEARNFSLRLAFARHLPPTPACACSSAGGASCSSAWPTPGPRAAAEQPRHLCPLAHGAHHRVHRARHRLARPPHRAERTRGRASRPDGSRSPQRAAAKTAMKGDTHEHGPGGHRGSGQLRQLPRPRRRVLPRRRPEDIVPGLMHVTLGGYHVRDVEFVAAFDVDAAKVGVDLSKAILAGHNNTIQFATVGHLDVTVQRGPTFDGLGTYYRDTVEESPAEAVDVAQALHDARADVLVSYLPVGSEEAQRYYAQACLDAGVAFVNAIPVFIASDPDWARKLPRRRRAHHRRRHQEPGRLHHRPPGAHPAVRGPRPGPRPDLPAELRREHGLQEHARAQAARVQEDLQDPGRHEPGRELRPRCRRRPHRPVGPRALAQRPQVGLHPDGGAELRRRAHSTSSSSSRCGTRPTRPA